MFDNKINIFLTFVVALYADILSVNSILVAVNPAFTGVMSFMYIAVLVLFVGALIFNTSKIFTVNPKVTFLILCVLVAFIFRGPNSTEMPLYFCCQVLLALIISQVRVNVKLFLLFVMAIPMFGVFFINSIFMLSIEEDGNIGMGMSYSFIVPVVASIVYYFLVFRKEDHVTFLHRLFVYAVLAVNFIYCVNLLIYGSRGVVFCLFLVFGFVLLFDIEPYRIGIHRKRGWLLVLFVIIIGLFFHVYDFLLWISNVLSNMGVNVYALNRTIEYAQMGDVTTGRLELYAYTWHEFLDKPILGHGMKTFESSRSDMVYPHNFFLQFLYDGGLVLTLVVLVPVVKSLIMIFKQGCFESICMVLTLFCATVPGAMFSHDLWSQPVLWLFFGCALTYDTTNKTNNPKFIY